MLVLVICDSFTVSPQVTLNRTFTNRTYMFGDSATLVCSSQGGPDNTYQWQRGGSDIPGEDSPVLSLTMIEISQGGEYTCVVTNAAGSNDDSTFLFVSPYFTNHPEDTLTNYGNSTTLECQAQAFPSPEYQWFREDGKQIRNEIADNASTLFIELVMFGDQGDYYCVASSRNVTERSQNATITGMVV